jgi:hypothetical protein
LCTGVEAGCGARTNIARRRGGSITAVLSDEAELWNRGHLRLSAVENEIEE